MAKAWSNAGGPWTDELVAYALNAFHRRHLRTPTVDEIRRGIDQLPSHATVRRMYGGVGLMYRRHGYLVRSRGGQPGRNVPMVRDALGRFVPASRP